MKNTTIILAIGLFLFSTSSLLAQPNSKGTTTDTRTKTTTTTTKKDPMGCSRKPNKQKQNIQHRRNTTRQNQGRTQKIMPTHRTKNNNNRRPVAKAKKQTSTKKKLYSKTKAHMNCDKPNRRN